MWLIIDISFYSMDVFIQGNMVLSSYISHKNLYKQCLVVHEVNMYIVQLSTIIYAFIR